jgi:hypothetical protein
VFAVASDVSYASSIQPFIMRSYQHLSFESQETMYDTVPQGTNEMPLDMAAVATSAAPTYFTTGIEWKHDGVTTSLVDGGLGFNNPIFLAIHELKRTFGWDTEVELVVSLGTGLPNLELSEHEKSVLAWGTTVVNIATEGDLIHNNFQLMRPMLAGFRDSVYARFNPPQLGSEAMDDPTEPALRAIGKLTDSYMKSKNSRAKIREIKFLMDKSKASGTGAQAELFTILSEAKEEDKGL